MERILIVDDDIDLCDLVAEYLEMEGFSLEAAHTGPNGVARALSNEHALVVLDVMLPGLGGFEVLRRIRAASPIPVLMLTARDEQIDRIVGLEFGADDYMHKPFHPRELIARIRAILRRARPAPAVPTVEEPPSAPVSIVVGDIEIDPGAREARLRGVPVALTTVEFDVLTVLLQGAGRVLSRSELTKRVFDRKLLPLERTLDMHISNLRRKLGLHENGSERIKSVRGAGYLYTLRGQDEAV